MEKSKMLSGWRRVQVVITSLQNIAGSSKGDDFEYRVGSLRLLVKIQDELVVLSLVYSMRTFLED